MTGKLISKAVEGHSCVDTVTGIWLVEQYTTLDKYLRAGRFDSKVFCQLLTSLV